jgi:hypothetical protein
MEPVEFTSTPFSGSVGFAFGTAFLVLNADFRKRAGVAVGDEVAVRLTPRGGAAEE